jgi:YgiT-type zinc finger domain-containing protein
MPLPPASEFGSCPCGGDNYEQRFVEVRMTVAGRVILLQDVPQGACPSCGSRVYKAVQLEGIEALMQGRALPPPRVRY